MYQLQKLRPLMKYQRSSSLQGLLSRPFMQRQFSSQEKEQNKEEPIIEVTKPIYVDKKSLALCSLAIFFAMYYIEALISFDNRKQKKVKVIGKPKIGGSFQFLNSQGKIVTEKDFLGKYVIMYFGYMSSKDIVPQNLQKLSQLKKSLDQKPMFQDSDSQIEYLFVSLDPERDNYRELNQFTSKYFKELRGCVIPPNQIKETFKKFKLYSYKIFENADNYKLENTPYFYIFDKKGEFMSLMVDSGIQDQADFIEDIAKEAEALSKQSV